MRALEKTETWESVSKKAYWDRDVPLEKWRARISAGHPSYLPDAVAAMSVPEFVHFYGVERFLHDWPRLRTLLPEHAAKKTGVHDLAWSRLAGGGWNLRPVPDFYTMPERRRQFFVEVARAPGKSIYEIAKALGMQYRRAYDHATGLILEEKIRGLEVMEGGRRKTRLYPSYKDAVLMPG